MRECLNNSELCSKLDEIGRICSSIALAHLGMNVKLDSLALGFILPLRRFFRTEESGYS